MDVIEGCEVAEEKREKRVLIGFRTTEKGYRPLSVPYLSRHSNTILFVFLSRVVRFVQARESQRGDILSSPPSNIIIHEKDIWGKKKMWRFLCKRRILSFGNCLSFSHSFPWFHIVALWSSIVSRTRWILYLPSSKKTVRLPDGDSFHFVSSRLNLIARQPVERFPKVSFGKMEE